MRKALYRNSEKKYLDIALQSTSVSLTPTTSGYFTYTALSQGSGDTQRIGDSINVTSLHVKGYTTRADTTNIVRLIVFLWKPLSSDIAPLAGSVIDSSTWSADPTQAYYNVDRRRKPRQYKVLYDKTWYLDSDHTIIPFSFNYMPKTPIKINFASGSSTASDNQIYFQMMSDSAAASHPILLFSSRIYYTDC